MTRYLERLFAGEAPSVSEWNEHLVEFHRAYDDVMFASASLLRTADGETSYEFLTRRVGEIIPDARAILDIGCGDGTLLRAMRQRFGENVRLTGIDLSACEIERARERLPVAEFHIGDAAIWPFGADTYDLVTAHMSLRVMGGVDAILARVKSTLRKNGALAMVLEDPAPTDPVGRGIAVAIAEIRAVYPEFVPLIPDWHEGFDVERFLQRLEACGFTRDVSVERFDVEASASSDEMVRLVERAYPFGLLADDVRCKVRDALTRHVNVNINGSGLMSVRLPLLLVVARV